MKRKKVQGKNLIIQSIVLLTLVVISIVLSILKNNQAVCEWFTRNLARWWIFLFGNLFGWLPISTYELFLIVAIVYIICYIVFLIKNLSKKSFLKALSITLTFLIVVSSVYAVYLGTASMAYNRDSLALDFYEYDRDNFDLPQSTAEEIARIVIHNFNYLMANVVRDEKGNTVLPFSITEMGRVIGKDYDRVLGGNDYFSPYNVVVRPILNKRIMSEMRIYGVFFTPSGGGTINPYVPTYHMGITIAHEMAHGKGIMYESDANMVAYYICLQSQNMYVQYSAYSAIYYYAVSILQSYKGTEEFRSQLFASIDSAYYNEVANNMEVWSQFTLLNDLGKKLNDWYLKLQGQDNGTGSYDDGKIPDTDIIEDPDTGEEVEIVVYLSQVQRMLIQLYLDGKLNYLSDQSFD